jgi:hypothetical protein
MLPDQAVLSELIVAVDLNRHWASQPAKLSAAIGFPVSGMGFCGAKEVA